MVQRDSKNPSHRDLHSGEIQEAVSPHIILNFTPMRKIAGTPTKGSTAHRLVTAAFGTFFTIVAVALFVISERTIGPMLAAGGLAIVGINAIVSACRNTPSLLSRIGPLP